MIIELKNPTKENATVASAYEQLRTYKDTIPLLFRYNGILVISDGLEAKAGCLSSELNRFTAWKSADGKTEASRFINQLEILVNGMLNKATLLDLIYNFVIFEKSSTKDPKTVNNFFTYYLSLSIFIVNCFSTKSILRAMCFIRNYYYITAL